MGSAPLSLACVRSSPRGDRCPRRPSATGRSSRRRLQRDTRIAAGDRLGLVPGAFGNSRLIGFTPPDRRRRDCRRRRRLRFPRVRRRDRQRSRSRAARLRRDPAAPGVAAFRLPLNITAPPIAADHHHGRDDRSAPGSSSLAPPRGDGGRSRRRLDLRSPRRPSAPCASSGSPPGAAPITTVPAAADGRPACSPPPSRCRARTPPTSGTARSRRARAPCPSPPAAPPATRRRASSRPASSACR